MRIPSFVIRALVIAGLVTALGCTMSRRSAAPVVASAPATVSAAAAPAPRAGSHADHIAKHGGIFFMDGNLYHHLEGTYPEPGLFRVYLYDDYTRPLDARGTTGAIHFDSAPETERIPVEYDDATQALVARFPPPALPVSLQLFLNLTNPLTGTTKESLFDFQFTRVGGEPSAPQAHDPDGHVHGTGEHSHLAPHGGQVVSVGSDHHFELVESPGMLTLWLLDAQEQALSVEGMSASLLIQPAQGAPITLPLPAMGTVHFMANSPLKPGERAVAVASVTMEGTTKTGRFTLGSAP